MDGKSRARPWLTNRRSSAVTSKRQIAANRRNARRSTGPRSLAGKFRSRANAVRHGLTAETVVAVFESSADYTEFEDFLIEQCRPRSIIERELVLRLSSLLWRLRRATAIETGLFNIQGRIMEERQAKPLQPTQNLSQLNLYQTLGFISAADKVERQKSDGMADNLEYAAKKIAPAHEFAGKMRPMASFEPKRLAQCFMRVSRLDNQLFDRLGRYEVALWRQTAQVIRMLSRRDAT